MLPEPPVNDLTVPARVGSEGVPDRFVSACAASPEPA
jgi:hypothetical protein